jgi:hypothetical protein
VHDTVNQDRGVFKVEKDSEFADPQAKSRFELLER